MADALVLPSTRQEAWRWADVGAIAAAAELPRLAAAAPPFLEIDGPRLLFVDGVFDAGASAPGHVRIGAVEAATDHALGSRAVGTGWSLTIGRGQAAGAVQVVHVSTGGENHLPARIVLAEAAVAAVVETYVGSGWANRLTQVELGQGAQLMRSVRLLQDGGFVSLREEATLGEGARLVSVFLGAGAMGSRIDGAVMLIGEGGHAEFGGALLTAGGRRQECAVVVRHAAANGASRQVWRAVAADTSVASLAARVEVARDAQKTDGEQSLRGLLLARTATVNLKPELEIFADDVKCAHGATVGELDRNALFYLQSRGISPGSARALLTKAFVADALDRIGDESVRAAFVEDADAWLEDSFSRRERVWRR